MMSPKKVKGPLSISNVRLRLLNNMIPCPEPEPRNLVLGMLVK